VPVQLIALEDGGHGLQGANGETSRQADEVSAGEKVVWPVNRTVRLSVFIYGVQQPGRVGKWATGYGEIKKFWENSDKALDKGL